MYTSDKPDVIISFIKTNNTRWKELKINKENSISNGIKNKE
jgi:hypothetical protein